MGSLTIHSLATNAFQVGILGVGVSLLLLWINYLKAGRDRLSAQEAEDTSARQAAASATRGRMSP